LESLAHFEEKLLLLYDLLSTPEARELAKPRLALLQEFYHQYKEETK
jgi:HD superfamily phosphodiesterase